MIEARIKQGRLSFAESEHLLASLNGLADGVPNPLISKMHDMAVAKGELKPYSVVWWDEKCDRIVFDLEAANLVRHKRGARHLNPRPTAPMTVIASYCPVYRTNNWNMRGKSSTASIRGFVSNRTN